MGFKISTVISVTCDSDKHQNQVHGEFKETFEGATWEVLRRSGWRTVYKIGSMYPAVFCPDHDDEEINAIRKKA